MGPGVLSGARSRRNDFRPPRTRRSVGDDLYCRHHRGDRVRRHVGSSAEAVGRTVDGARNIGSNGADIAKSQDRHSAYPMNRRHTGGIVVSMDTSVQVNAAADHALAAPDAAASRAGAPTARTGTRDWWVLPAYVGVLGLAAFVYVYNLSISGYANTYYSMAAQAAGRDWAAWFWGSLDSSSFITLDKPPLATMLIGLSVRVFGLSSWSILLPQAACGVATVAVLYLIVRRSAGPVAATIAALVAALTPAAVLIFRFNNPDALLTLLLVLAAWAFMRAIEDGRLRWIVLAGLFVGLAFNTKFLQAYLVLPAFALVYGVAAPGSVRRRALALGIAAVSVAVFSSWWVLA